MRSDPVCIGIKAFINQGVNEGKGATFIFIERVLKYGSTIKARKLYRLVFYSQHSQDI